MVWNMFRARKPRSPEPTPRKIEPNEVVIRALRGADAAQVERDGPQTFVGIDVAASAIFQDGDRAMAEVIVELVEGAIHNALGFVPRTALAEHRFTDAHEEKRLPQIVIGLMREQIRNIEELFERIGAYDPSLTKQRAGESST